MNRIKVRCEIRTYADDEAGRVDGGHIVVHSHWNNREKVVIENMNGKWTVMAEDLIQAVRNCTNAN